MDCDIKQSHSGIVLATEVGVKPFWKALAGWATFDSSTPSKLPPYLNAPLTGLYFSLSQL